LHIKYRCVSINEMNKEKTFKIDLRYRVVNTNEVNDINASSLNFVIYEVIDETDESYQKADISKILR